MVSLRIILVVIFQAFCLISFSHSFLFSSVHKHSLLVSEQVPISFLFKNKKPKLSKKLKKSTIKIVRKNSIIFKFKCIKSIQI